MSGRIRNERGSALVVAMAVMMVMLLFGLATISLSDGQSKVSGSERTAESTFNLVDAVLKNELYVIGQQWPGSSGSALPSCDQTSATTLCPAQTTLGPQFTGPDYAAGVAWTVKIQDNGGSVQNYYTTSGAAGQPGWDANGDGRMWIRASATVRGRTRVLVTQVKPTVAAQPFPRNAVTAGFFGTNNQGKKVIVDTKGSAAQGAPVAVRCNVPPKSPGCLDYDPTKGQVSPDTHELNYTGGPAQSQDQLDALRAIARSESTYFPSGCPASLAGAHVFIESGNCTIGSNTVVNSAANPGMVVIANGTLTLGGNAIYYGLVYGANLQGSTGNVVSVGGTATIYGAVAVDGGGGVFAGSSKANIIFDPNAFNNVQGFASAAAVQGTWREIAPTR